MVCTQIVGALWRWESKGQLGGKTEPLLVEEDVIVGRSSAVAGVARWIGAILRWESQGRDEEGVVDVKVPPPSPCDTGDTCSTASTEHPRPTDEITQRRPLAPPSWRFWAENMCATCLWVAASVIIILCIKTTTALPDGLYPHSFAFTVLVQPTTGCLAWAVDKALHRGRPPLPPMERSEYVKLLALGLVQGIETGLTNKALQYLSVASRTMLNSMSVLFMMTTAWCWGLEKIGWRRAMSGALFIAGGVLESRDAGLEHESKLAVHLYTVGICMQLASMICRSQRWCLTQFVLQLSPPDSALGQMTKLQLLSRMLPVAGIVCLPCVLIFEPTAFTAEQLLQEGLPLRVLLVAGGLTAMLFAELTLVKQLSAVTFNVLSTVHQIPIVLVGVVFQHNRVTEPACCGFAICLLGAFVYAWARSVELRIQSKPGWA